MLPGTSLEGNIGCAIADPIDPEVSIGPEVEIPVSVAEVVLEHLNAKHVVAAIDDDCGLGIGLVLSAEGVVDGLQCKGVHYHIGEPHQDDGHHDDGYESPGQGAVLFFLLVLQELGGVEEIPHFDSVENGLVAEHCLPDI